MVNAADARKLSKLNAERLVVEETIDKAIEAGKLECQLEGHLQEKTTQFLENYGYKVTKVSDNGIHYTLIEW